MSDSYSNKNALPIGTIVEGYRIESVLGTGGFGITYKATDINLQHQVAIKEYLPAFIATRESGLTVAPISSDDLEEYTYGLQGFIEEGRTLARFRHPNIVRVVRHFETNGTSYLVMDYEQGVTLNRYLHDHPFPDEPFLRRLLADILDGIKLIHSNNFLHRDIKPGNIIIRETGEPVLIDFGSARQTLMDSSTTVTRIVSDGYAPIEQYAREGNLTAATDLYALGATLYYAVCGKKMSSATDRVNKLQYSESDLVKSAEHSADSKYSKQLLQTIDHMIALYPDDRPASADQVIELLAQETTAETARETNKAPATGSDTGTAQPAWLSFIKAHGVRLAIAGIALLIGSLAAIIWFADFTKPPTVTYQTPDYNKIRLFKNSHYSCLLQSRVCRKDCRYHFCQDDPACRSCNNKCAQTLAGCTAQLRKDLRISPAFVIPEKQGLPKASDTPARLLSAPADKEAIRQLLKQHIALPRTWLQSDATKWKKMILVPTPDDASLVYSFDDKHYYRYSQPFFMPPGRLIVMVDHKQAKYPAKYVDRYTDDKKVNLINATVYQRSRLYGFNFKLNPVYEAYAIKPIGRVGLKKLHGNIAIHSFEASEHFGDIIGPPFTGTYNALSGDRKQLLYHKKDSQFAITDFSDSRFVKYFRVKRAKIDIQPDKTVLLQCRHLVEWYPSKTRIACTRDNIVYIYDASTMQLLKQIVHNASIVALALSADASRLYLVDSIQRGVIKEFDTTTGAATRELLDNTPNSVIQSIKTSARGNRLFALNSKGYLLMWKKLASGQFVSLKVASSPSINWLRNFHTPQRVKRISQLQLYPRINRLAVAENGYLVALARIDNVIEIWDMRTQETVLELYGHSGFLSSLAFYDNDSKLISTHNHYTHPPGSKPAGSAKIISWKIRLKPASAQ